MLKPFQSINMSTDMSVEINRGETFEKWIDNTAYSKNDKTVYKKKLAKYGFFLIRPTQVVCFHCKTLFTVKNVIDNTMIMHKICSSNCPNIKTMELEEALIKFKIEDENETETDQKEKEQEDESREDESDSDEDEIEEMLIHDKMPIYPQYKTKEARLKSFVNWPIFIAQHKRDLSNAGFFYTGRADKVICYSCAGGIRNWGEEDDPWTEHIIRYRFCTHVQLNKNIEEIENALKTRFDLKLKPINETNNDQETSYIPGMDVTEDLTTEYNIDAFLRGLVIAMRAEKMLCRGDVYKNECMKCNFNESNSVVFPCAHVVTCFDCSKNIKNCFRCDKKIKKVKKIYFT